VLASGSRHRVSDADWRSSPAWCRRTAYAVTLPDEHEEAAIA
jgi:hypothetical protein